MSTIKVNGELYKIIVKNGAVSLRNDYKRIDALNVFPVPDGDTGTNMSMTIEAGVSALENENETSIYLMSKKFSRGMLMGARGNSGVILSQFFRGIYKGLEGFDEVGAKEFAKAFKRGVEQAYKAVMKPVEGTILTVCREASEYAFKNVSKKSSIEDFFELFLKEAYASLERTPDLLPALKDACVVDSGAAGFIQIIEGMYKAVKGEILEHIDASSVSTNSVNRGSFNAHSELTYGYCTEFILQLQHSKVDVANFDEKVITDELQVLGDSIVCFKDEDIIKVHVHTKTPGIVLGIGQKYGEFITLKIENMSIQHNESEEVQEQCNCEQCVEMRSKQERKKYAVVAVASGTGLVNMFKSMGVDYVVSGGQTMNPSSEDFVTAFDSINAENIIVFPNNSNIVMAAQQAGKYYDKANVVVIKTKSLAQGYSALTVLDLSSDNLEEIQESIQEVITNVTTGLVTYSIRDASIDGIEIKKDDYIGIINGRMVASTASRVETVKEMLKATDLSEKYIVTIITGCDANPAETEEIIAHIAENYPDIETDVVEGNQEVYSYILSLE
ncbi:MAG: DAK2 domain-containing protein [Bacilli bacterium]|nr:DAK2 domain-containing protein [Bacilli bacterium]